MTQNVRVKKRNSDGTAQVVHIRQSACSGDCHKCSGCGAVQEAVELTARNPIEAEAGDLVVMESETGPVLAAAAVLYVLPLVLFFVGYFLGQALFSQGGVAGCLAFVLSVVLVIRYDRRMARRKETVYTITGFVSEP